MNKEDKERIDKEEKEKKDRMSLDLIDRIKQISEVKEASPRQFAKRIDFKYSTLNNYLIKRRLAVDHMLLMKILSSYSDIDARWLITGSGNMLIEDEKAAPAEQQNIESSEYMLKRFEELIRENESLKNEIQDLKNEKGANVGTRTYTIDKTIRTVAEPENKK